MFEDSCTVGRAECLGDTRKLWFLFPPTEKNLRIFSENITGNHPSLLKAIGTQLEGGLFTTTGNTKDDEGNVLIMGEGTLHAVVTLPGGFLGGYNWGTSESIPLAAEMLRMRIVRDQLSDQLREDFSWFQRIFTETLRAGNQQHCRNALYSLSRLLDEVETFPGRGHDELVKDISSFSKDMWKDWYKRNKTRDGTIVCECGAGYKEFRKHFGTAPVCSRVDCISE